MEISYLKYEQMLQILSFFMSLTLIYLSSFVSYELFRDKSYRRRDENYTLTLHIFILSQHKTKLSFIQQT